MVFFNFTDNKVQLTKSGRPGFDFLVDVLDNHGKPVDRALNMVALASQPTEAEVRAFVLEHYPSIQSLVKAAVVVEEEEATPPARV